MGLPLQRPLFDEHEAIQGAKRQKIRTLNDRLRKSLTGGRAMMTRGR
jgi:hypothetical protein